MVPLQAIATKHLQTMRPTELDANWKLNDFFGMIYVINLPQAEGRRKKIIKELKSIGTKDFELFSAVDGHRDLDSSIWKKLYLNLRDIDLSTEAGILALDHIHQGQAGCYMSHYQIIKKVKESFEQAQRDLLQATNDVDYASAKEKMFKFSRVLILEDDSGFGLLKNGMITKKKAGYLLRKTLQELPDHWDMLYFVVHPLEPTIKVSSHLYRLNASWSLNAYAINYTMYGPLYEHIKKIECPEVTQILPIDYEIHNLHKDYNVYAVYPSLVYSQEGPSYITERSWTIWQGQPIYQSQE